ncbi:MAG: hypothetical protein FRX49_10269 [Trebouxia sp. A1-2]|nr:MAG: hypothetical protein FRX49_10269 [Trebouxia sp. A1-2]
MCHPQTIPQTIRDQALQSACLDLSIRSNIMTIIAIAHDLPRQGQPVNQSGASIWLLSARLSNSFLLSPTV